MTVASMVQDVQTPLSQSRKRPSSFWSTRDIEVGNASQDERNGIQSLVETAEPKPNAMTVITNCKDVDA